mgnify:CR=1 FL=1
MLLLTVSLAVGGTIALLDYQDADRFEDFHVVRGAVEVPNPEAILEKSHEDEGGEPVALNSASAEELQQLPLIGPKTAALILQHRDRHGPFETLQSLARVKGIGPRTLERLRDLVVLR